MQSVSLETQLPEIKVVRHARARNLRLRVEPTGIRLTVPIFCTKRQIQQFLQQSEQWLLETWSKQQEQFNQTQDKTFLPIFYPSSLWFSNGER